MRRGVQSAGGRRLPSPEAIGLWLVASLALMVVACGKIPATHYYSLAPQRPAATADGGLRIGIETFDVDPPYDQDRIVYRVGGDAVEVGFYAYHRWAVSLGRMLPVLVADALGGRPGVRSAEPSRSGGKYDLLVTGRLMMLEEVDEEAAVASVRARLSLTALTPAGETLWSSVVDHEQPSSAADVEGVVRDMREMLRQAVDTAAAEMSAVLAAQDAR